MKRRLAKQRAFMWSAVLTINCLVGLMFVVIFTSIPITDSATIVSVAPKDSRQLALDSVVEAGRSQAVEPIAVEARKAPAPRVGVPVRVEVPFVGINLQVLNGSYDEASQAWTLNDTDAFYADRTVPVNTSNGSTLVYGHATSAVFGRIGELAEGSTAIIYTANNFEFRYEFESSRQVTPDDATVFDINGPPTLVLQTCAGPFDVYRTFVTFRFVEAVAS